MGIIKARAEEELPKSGEREPWVLLQTTLVSSPLPPEGSLPPHALNGVGADLRNQAHLRATTPTNLYLLYTVSLLVPPLHCFSTSSSANPHKGHLT